MKLEEGIDCFERTEHRLEASARHRLISGRHTTVGDFADFADEC